MKTMSMLITAQITDFVLPEKRLKWKVIGRMVQKQGN